MASIQSIRGMPSALLSAAAVLVSLARNVRDQSAQQLTRDLLRQLAVVVEEYARRERRFGRISQAPITVAADRPDRGSPLARARDASTG